MDAAEYRDNQPEAKSAVSEAYEWVESFLVPLLAFLLIITFFARLATVNGISMLPTLHNGERLILQQAGYAPEYGDVVVVDRSITDEDAIVKRVIGKEGDVIFIDFASGEVWRNDTLLDEPYINEPTMLQYDISFPVKVPAGCVFVMGDNRNHSLDSRSSDIGMVDVRHIMGKAVFRFFPFNKFGGIS